MQLKQYTTSLFLGVLALSLVLPTVSKALSYEDIVNAQIQAHGQVLGSVTPSPDINGDGIVNAMDMSILVGHWGQSYAPADLNNDGVVNSADFSIVSSWWFSHR